MALALIAILAAPLAIFAQDSADTTITGTVGAALTVTAPTTINLPPLVPGTVVSSAPQSVTVTTNTAGWTLTVVESGTNPDGQMSTSGGILLNNDMMVAVGGGTPPSVQSVITLGGGSGSGTINSIVFSQQVAANAAPGTYSIIVTFTANPGT